MTVHGRSLTLHNTSKGERTIEFEIRPSGTGEQLIVRGERSLEFGNDDGTKTTATLFIDLLLRR